MDVLVTGGSGHLGREIVRLLQANGEQPRVLSRSAFARTGVESVVGDLATGEGVEQAVAGVEMVVHAATHSPSAQRGGLRPVDFFHTPADVEIDGTQRLLAAAEDEGVSHFVHVSIVGVDRSRLPYLKMKLAAEDLVANSGVPSSIVRATPFYWLLHRYLDGMRRMPLWVLPAGVEMQPGDESEAAAHVVDCALEGAYGMRPEFAGPEIVEMRELAREYLAASGLQRPIVPVPLPKSVAQSAGSVPEDDAVTGELTWREWLRHGGERVEEEGRKVVGAAPA